MKTFIIWMTTDCNMNCTYCYEGRDKKHINISEDILQQTLLFIQKYMASYQDEELVVDFHGGEPLLQYDKVIYAVKTLREKYGEGIRFGITTNGTIMTDNVLKLLTNEFDYSLTVSLDGEEKYHNMNRKMKTGEGSYEKAMQTALSILKIRKDVRIRMTVNSRNVCNFCNNVLHLLNMGFSVIAPAIDYFDLSWDQDSMYLLENQLIDLKRCLKDMDKENIRVGLVDDYRQQKIGICLGGLTSFHINPKGQIYPCSYAVGELQYLIGDVKNGINNEKVKWFQTINDVKNMDCMGCGHEEACLASRCKLLNYYITNNLYLPAPTVCTVENIKKRVGLIE
jgi:uncharacterized protein